MQVWGNLLAERKQVLHKQHSQVEKVKSVAKPCIIWLHAASADHLSHACDDVFCFYAAICPGLHTITGSHTANHLLHFHLLI